MLIKAVIPVFGGLAVAQQVYVPGNGTVHASCPSVTAPAKITPATTSFTYTLTETTRYASSLKPNATTSTYALAYGAVSSLFANQSTTSWGNWYPNATATATDESNPYGNAAWTAMWKDSNLANFTRGIYTSTVSPTPVPTSELLLPPPLYFRPQACHPLPSGFILGTSGAAAQIEGAIADEGRGPAVPDFIPQYEGPVAAPANDFSTTENYYLYKQDINRLAAIGVEYYSFSIPWTRILPFTYPGSPVNSLGLQHYDDLINYALSKGVKPTVTLVHNDVPLQFFGNYSVIASTRSYFGYGNLGYQSPGFEDAYVNYGKIVMAHFADRVPIWVTFNEPQTGVVNGKAVDAVIKSHARLHHYYHEVLNGTGRITMKMGGTPGVPRNPKNESDLVAVQLYNDFSLGPYLDTLVLGQDYPANFKAAIQDYVPLSTADLSYLKGTMDIVSFDGYTLPNIEAITSDYEACWANNATTNTMYPSCVGSLFSTSNNWAMGYNSDYFVYNTAPYLRTQLLYLWKRYATPVFISEFGISTTNLLDQDPIISSYDTPRSEYYLSYLTEISKSIYEDGVDFIGVLMWSTTDNWEWGSYEHQLGVQGNNLTTQERYYRRSLFDVVDFVTEGKKATE